LFLLLHSLKPVRLSMWRS